MFVAELRALKEPLYWVEKADQQPGEGYATIHLTHAALNHRDVFIQDGLYGNIQLPCVLGSDGVGIVTAINGRASYFGVGDRVLVSPSINWGSSETVQGPDFRVLGMPDQGTLATHIVRPITEIFPCPAYLSDAAAAALPLAGLTAFRALFSQGRCTTDDTVLVTGIGGGVAMMALQLATAAGATVWVTSGSMEKIAIAKKHGAVGGISYHSPKWGKQLAAESGGFSLIIDGAGGEGYNQLIQAARPGARIVSYGGTAGPIPELRPQQLFWKQLHLIGSTMGSPADFTSLLSFVAKHEIRPVVDKVFPVAAINMALDYLRSGQQQGKIVVAINA